MNYLLVALAALTGFGTVFACAVLGVRRVRGIDWISQDGVEAAPRSRPEDVDRAASATASPRSKKA